MRTTVTIDHDVERLLREQMHRTRKSFKQTLNAALRAGLTPPHAAAGKRPRFVVKARPLGLRAGLDPAGMNKLVDEIDVEALLGRSVRAKRR